jgi:hypothetical protein
MVERILTALVAVPFLLGAAAAPGGEAQVAFSFQDREIVESSGLAVVGDLVATTNDSGDTGRVFAVDPATGETVGTTRWSSDPTDVEALAPGPAGSVWVGDIGDNTEGRDAVQVARVPVGRRDVAAEVTTYDLVYPDGPHDAETLVSDPATGRLYVATKGVLGGTLYAAPATLDATGPNELEPLGDVLPIATDGAFLADGTRLVVRNYAVAAVYAFPSLEKLHQLDLPDQPQGEGLAVDGDGSLLLGSEGSHADVLRVALPEPVPSVTATVGPSESPTPRTESREDSELPETTESQRPVWPWFLTGIIGVGVIVVLTRSLRGR